MKKKLAFVMIVTFLGIGVTSSWALEPAQSIARKFRQHIPLGSNSSINSNQLIGAIIHYNALLKAAEHDVGHGNPEPWQDDDNYDDPVDRAADNLDESLHEFMDAVEEDYDYLSGPDQELVSEYMNDLVVVLDDLDSRAFLIFGKTSNDDTRDRLITIIDYIDVDTKE